MVLGLLQQMEAERLQGAPESLLNQDGATIFTQA